MLPLLQRTCTLLLSKPNPLLLAPCVHSIQRYGCQSSLRARFSVSSPRAAKKLPHQKVTPKASNSPSKGPAKPTPKATPRSDPRAWHSPTLSRTAAARDLFNPIVQRFLKRTSPALLYQAPSPTLYFIGCYVIGGLCFLYAVFNFYVVVIRRPPDLKRWVIWAYAGICLFVAVFGAYVLRKTYRLVKNVSIIPTQTAAGTTSLLLRIENFRMLPWWRPKALVTPYERANVTGPRFYSPPKVETKEEKNYREYVEEEKRQWERDHILTLPFRQAGDKLRRFFWFMKGLFTNDGFLVLRANGQRGRWMLNERAAWLLEGGKPFDAFVKQNHDSW